VQPQSHRLQILEQEQAEVRAIGGSTKNSYPVSVLKISHVVEACQQRALNLPTTSSALQLCNVALMARVRAEVLDLTKKEMMDRWLVEEDSEFVFYSCGSLNSARSHVDEIFAEREDEDGETFSLDRNYPESCSCMSSVCSSFPLEVIFIA